MRLGADILAMAFVIATLALNATMTVEYLNTTVVLNQNTSAHVVEILYLQVSNDSMAQYIQDRQAVNLTISNWQQVLNTDLLVQHILNAHLGMYDFTFLPGPIRTVPNGGIATLVFDYYVRNVTTVKQVAPRKFSYSFNDSVFNFMHIASGQALPPNARLNIIVPKGTQVLAAYPLPDNPLISIIGNFSGQNTFSWYSGEPLEKFTFTYLVTQSLEQEVVTYVSQLYSSYSLVIFIVVVAAIALGAIYLYTSLASPKG